MPLEGTRILEVGTGTGGVTVELARAVGTGSVISLDPEEKAIETARANLIRAGVEDRVELIRSSAPEGLPDQGRFDIALVGGHGNRLEEVVRACWQRLLPGGRILISAVLLDTAAEAPRIIRSLGGEAGSLLLSSATGRPAGKRWMYLAQNPVYLFWADKPENGRNGRE
jgi:precorrin-6Y C5,15-methyltransferase (decarboxylating) CbiT subunit